ncbi:MAG TPA: phage GP46 family protein [Acetobacteraceae bacterium]|jgi:phage gp46-like protein|nr:phage GP46 family protein [Acetobacteraceae bacterium]
MGDATIAWDPVTGTGDLVMNGGDLQQGYELQTAVLISIFSDAQADPGDIVPDTNDPRGVWFDTYAAYEDPTLPVIANDRFGSKLWQAFVRIRNQDTLNWMRDELITCLSWMITDGVASAVDASPYYLSNGGIGARVMITANGVNTIYDYAWGAGNLLLPPPT